jgi:hypothetical protein
MSGQFSQFIGQGSCILVNQSKIFILHLDIYVNLLVVCLFNQLVIQHSRFLMSLTSQLKLR